MEIREAKVSDAKGIAIVHVKTWQYAYKGLMPDKFLSELSVDRRAQRWSETLANLNNQIIWVTEDNNQIIGFCSVGSSRDAYARSDTGELYSIYIDPLFMGQGIGSKLMARGLESLKSKGFNKATLWVLETNEPSIKFYEHKGWTPDGTTKTEQRDEFDLKEARYFINL